MKQRLIIFLSLLGVLLTSCQKDDLDQGSVIPGSGDEVPVMVSFSMKNALQTSSEQVPMGTRADETVKAVISNLIKVLIAKKVDGKLILEKVIEHRLDPSDRWNSNKYDVTESAVFDPISFELRPGDYRMTIITGAHNLTWNGTLEPGKLVGYVDENENATFNTPWACTYDIASMYLNIGWPQLGEEVFAGVSDFVVAKTDDLHSLPKENTVHVDLKRKVAKLRIALKMRTEEDPGSDARMDDYPERINITTLPTQDFLLGFQNGITAELTPVDPNQEFYSGLDVWGNPHKDYYRNDEFRKKFMFGAFTWRITQTGSDNLEYLLGMIKTTSHCCGFIFMKEGEEMPIQIKNIKVTAYSGGPTYEHDGIVSGVVLKHNTITGIVMKSGNIVWEIAHYQGGGTYNSVHKELVLDTVDGEPVKSESLFDSFQENKNPPSSSRT